MSAVTRVGVIGAGGWGTTLASLFAARADTVLWAREPEVVASLHETGRNEMYLPGLPVSPALRSTNDADEALAGAELTVLAVPAQHLRAVMALIDVPSTSIVLNVAKGLEAGSCKRMTEVIADMLPHHDRDRIGVLSGPNLAREVMGGHPSATCVSFGDPDAAERTRELLMSDTLRVYTSDDVIGCEIGGAVKNVIAIASGVADGLGYGMNTRAALLTRGLAELTRLGVALGGRPLTFLGLAGNGDLIATCSSPQSRNFRVGRMLADGIPIDAIVEQMTMVAEGVATAPVVVALAERVGIELPIASAVAALLSGRHRPEELVTQLMTRDPKPEAAGLELTQATTDGRSR